MILKHCWRTKFGQHFNHSSKPVLHCHLLEILNDVSLIYLKKMSSSWLKFFFMSLALSTFLKAVSDINQKAKQNTWERSLRRKRINQDYLLASFVSFYFFPIVFIFYVSVTWHSLYFEHLSKWGNILEHFLFIFHSTRHVLFCFSWKLCLSCLIQASVTDLPFIKSSFSRSFV